MGGVPELRFPEFSGEWREVELGTMMRVTTGNKDTKDKIDDGSYPFFVRSNTVETIDTFAYDGEAVLTSGDGVGVGKNYHYIHGKFNFHQRVYCMCDFDRRLIGKYFYYYFSNNFYRRVIKMSAKNSVDSVRRTMITEMNLPLPSLPEQQKIADFLTSVDEKIAILTDKITRLEAYKKGMMQKLMSGELRFPGFTDAWREVKLGEVGKIITGTTPPTKNTENYGEKYLWVTPTDIGDEKNVTYTKKMLSELGLQHGKLIPKDSLLVTCIASIGKNAILRENGSCNQQINALSPNNDFNVDFLYYLIEFNTQKLVAYAGAGGMMILNKKDFSNLRFLFPSLPEQQKIADFLTVIDDKLTLEKERLEALKRYKQGLLQKMFV